MPLISVIVPVYKVEQYLDRCVESILGQTVSDLELILVDDGSPDRCGEICDQYAAQYPNVKVLHKQNQGQTPARKDGLKLATGKYVAFADSDDWIEPDMYERMIRKLEENEADMVITGYCQEWPDRTEYHENSVTSGVYQGEALAELCRLSVFSTAQMHPATSLSLWTKLFRREDILEPFLQIPGDLRIGEDALCTWSLLSRAGCVVIDNAHKPYHYRTWEGSITQRHYPNYSKDLCYLKNALDQLFGNGDVQMRSAIAYYYITSFLQGIEIEISRLNPAGFSQKCAGVGRFCRDGQLSAALNAVELSRFPAKTQNKLKLLEKKAVLPFMLYHKATNFLGRLKS